MCAAARIRHPHGGRRAPPVRIGGGTPVVHGTMAAHDRDMSVVSIDHHVPAVLLHLCRRYHSWQPCGIRPPHGPGGTGYNEKEPSTGDYLMARLFSFLREVATTALLVLVVFAASRMLVQNVQVHGTSMLPTLQNGEYVLVDTLSYRLHAPERGDIIIFHPPVDPGEDYVKRVIALPGDVIRVTKGTVSVNGQVLPEPYVRRPHTYSWGPARVP